MSGLWTKEDQEWWNNKENQFIFNFNLLWTSGDYWDRTPENVKPREEALRKLYRESCLYESMVVGVKKTAEAERLLKEVLNCQNNDRDNRGLCCQCRESINKYFNDINFDIYES